MNRYWSSKWGEFPRAEYIAWYNLNRRCYDPRHHHFANYGGRGIRVCGRWRHDFMAFLSDMGPRPSRAYSIDRIDNDGDYSPDNCRWATISQQKLNTGRVRYAAGVRREGNRWRAQIKADRRWSSLGSFATRAEARSAYRRAARRQRIISEISAAWAREAAAVAQGVADRYDGALDRELLDLLIRASRPPGVAGHGARRKDAARPGDQREPTKPRGAGRSRSAIDRSKQDGVSSGVNCVKRT